MTSQVERQVLVDFANISYFLKIAVHFLIGEDRQKSSFLVYSMIFGNDGSRHIKKKDIGGDIGLLTLGHDPTFTVEFNDVICCQMGHINVSESGEAGKDEYIPDCL